jgi:hypothetical protein
MGYSSGSIPTAFLIEVTVPPFRTAFLADTIDTPTITPFSLKKQSTDFMKSAYSSWQLLG